MKNYRESPRPTPYIRDDEIQTTDHQCPRCSSGLVTDYEYIWCITIDCGYGIDEPVGVLIQFASKEDEQGVEE